MSDTQKKRNTLRSPLRVVALVAVFILPFLGVLSGIYLLFTDVIITWSFAILFFILPLFTITGNVLIIRRNRRPVLRTVLCVIVLILFLISSIFLALLGHFSTLLSLTDDEALAQYSDIADDLSGLPAVSELGTPEKMEYYHFFNIGFAFFDSDCDILFCKYSHADYQAEKANLDNLYTFEQNPICAHGHSIDPIVTVDAYTFRFLSFSSEEYQYLYYPKYMVLIATNDETNEIVYLSYNDDDLDYITSIEEQIRNDFGWKYIR